MTLRFTKVPFKIWTKWISFPTIGSSYKIVKMSFSCPQIDRCPIVDIQVIHKRIIIHRRLHRMFSLIFLRFQFPWNRMIFLAILKVFLFYAIIKIQPFNEIFLPFTTVDTSSLKFNYKHKILSYVKRIIKRINFAFKN